MVPVPPTTPLAAVKFASPIIIIEVRFVDSAISAIFLVGVKAIGSAALLPSSTTIDFLSPVVVGIKNTLPTTNATSRQVVKASMSF